MSSIHPLLTLALVMMADIVILARLLRIRAGRFDVVRDDDDAFVALTDLGRISVHRQSSTLHVEDDSYPVALHLRDIARLDLRLKSRLAAGDEPLLHRAGIWNILAFQEKFHWYEISVETLAGARVPIFAVGQYEPREPLIRRWLDFEVWLLSALGIFEPLQVKAYDVLDRFQLAFHEFGRDLTSMTLTPKSSAPEVLGATQGRGA